MQTKIMIATLAGVALLASSCKLDDPKNELNINETTNNLIIPADPAEEVAVQGECAYSYNFDLVSGKVAVSTSDLNLNNGKASFTTSAMPFKLYYYGNKRIYSFNGGNGQMAGSMAGKQVSGLNGVLSEEFFLLLTNFTIYPIGSMQQMPIMEYKAGDYTIKTFASDSYFRGKTETTYPGKGGMKTYATEDPVYRIYMSQDFKKANVVIYNVRFAEEMPHPLQAVVLEGLELKFDRNGYTVTGADIVPKMWESNGLTPNEDRTFDSFRFSITNGNMATAECEYVCAKVFNGKFSGRCVPSLSEEK